MTYRGTIQRSHVACLLAMVIVACGCSTPHSPDVQVQIVGFGTIETVGLVMRADETSSVGAKLGGAKAMRVVAETQRIPLRPGVSYGIAFKVIKAPSEEVALKAVLRSSSPCTLKSSGQTVYHNDSVLRVKVGQLRHLAARIPASERESHCVGDSQAGTDTFQLWFDGKKVAEKTFEIYRP